MPEERNSSKKISLKSSKSIYRRKMLNIQVPYSAISNIKLRGLTLMDVDLSFTSLLLSDVSKTTFQFLYGGCGGGTIQLYFRVSAFIITKKLLSGVALPSLSKWNLSPASPEILKTRVLFFGLCQSLVVISSPARVSHVISLFFVPGIRCPLKNLERRKTT